MNKIRTIITVAQALLLLSGLVSSIRAESPSATKLKLQKAYFAERSEGDLDKAIDIYNQIIKQDETDRQFVAQAAFQLGCCYEKKGDTTKAVQYFQKVVSEYPGVEKWYDKAKLKLDELGTAIAETSPSHFEGGVPPQNVMHYLMTESFKGLMQSFSEGVSLNIKVGMVDESYRLYSGGFLGVSGSYEGVLASALQNAGMEPGSAIVGDKYYLGHFNPAYEDMKVYDQTNKQVKIEWVDSPKGGGDLYWLAGRKLGQEEKYYFYYTHGEPVKLSEDGKNAHLTIQNYFGPEVLELFFVVIPNTLKITNLNRDYSSCEHIDIFDVFLWKKRNPKNTNNIVAMDIKPGTGLGLLEVPWNDGDSFTLALTTQTGVDVGEMRYDFSKESSNGVKCWKIRGTTTLSIGTTAQETIVYADMDDFLPVRSITDSPGALGKIEASYEGDNVIITVDDKEPQSFPKDAIAFDNEQIMVMLRRLPLNDAYTKEFNIFSPVNAKVIKCKVEVVGSDTVNVPTGSYDCYNVELSCFSEGSMLLKHNIWVSKDKFRHIVKYDSGASVMLLSDIDDKSMNKTSQPMAVKDELQIDDGNSAGMQSFGGSAQVVRFNIGSEKTVIKQVKFYGSRYGQSSPPDEDFYITICDEKFKKLQTTACSYQILKRRGDLNWWTCDIDPIEVSGIFYVYINFDAHQTKGVYLHYGSQNSGNSFVGTAGEKPGKWDKGDWMLRVLTGKPGSVSALNTGRAKAGADKSQSSRPQTKELKADDGNSAGKQSFGGSSQAVKFDIGQEKAIVKQVKFYGSRYGQSSPPNEDFYITVCDDSYKKLKTTACSYRLLKRRGDLNWWTCDVDPVEVSGQFYIFINFDANQSKGVYLNYDRANSGNSFVGTAGEKPRDWDKGDWMLRAIVETTGISDPNSTSGGSGLKKVASWLKKTTGTKPETPAVVKTDPVVYKNDVPASLDKIVVEFNSEMQDGSWSWTGGGETYPETTGKPYYDSSKTKCTLPVKLAPGKVYVIGINSPKYKNFKSESGRPAKPYVVMFATSDKNGNPTEIPQDLLNQIKQINE